MSNDDALGYASMNERGELEFNLRLNDQDQPKTVTYTVFRCGPSKYNGAERYGIKVKNYQPHDSRQTTFL